MDRENEPNSNGLFSPPLNAMTQTIVPISSYKCCLCRKLVDDATLTCAKCVNTGRFCPSKHDTCSNKRRQTLISVLNLNDYEEFQEYSNKYSIHTPAHLQCSDRRFLLKKFNIEKTMLQAEYQTKMEPVIRLHQMSEEILLRKNRLNLVKQSIIRIQEQIERGKKAKIETQQHMDKINIKILLSKKNIHEINARLNSSNDIIRKKNELRIKEEKKLFVIRRKLLNEVYKYIFPIERVSSSVKEGFSLSIGGRDRYKIVDSCLPANGDYQIDKLLLTANVDNDNSDTDSLQSTLSHELYEVLSALSHACQLIHVIAFYLHIVLPFRLHQLEFNNDNLTTDRLRGDIAKLNANIISSCLSQDIPIENTNVTHTLENLLKLLKFERYRSRSKPVVYSQQYIDMMEEEIDGISRTYVTDYWFDAVETDVTGRLNNEEWETIS
ncbi:unnamed protein product [Rotaria sp. Silwood2]|nr:unnamed protein product [Rotaria sp. Silwood2]CAF2607980.1 unnamed protein product [Rotaria sp. Silwood2]CAF2849352.1 unnamed protein product [Rotaria sp. Silwood2]CAF3022092.1 unnamed protein product [Rotaria sp. Silwood2]CAF4019585.1 unnamed protein product [Rotaria sp. Silwood2]